MPFLKTILAMKRLFLPGSSTITTSHLSMVVSFSRS